MSVLDMLGAAFGVKAPAIAARLRAEPGFHVLLVPTTDAQLGCLWVEVEEWGLCASKIVSLDMFTAGSETTRLVPLVNGAQIAAEGRVQIGECFEPGVTADDALAALKQRGLISFPQEKL